MTIPIEQWGTRLSETLVRVLEAGKLDEARSLVLDGDGQTRSLAKEFAMMVGGLGITVRVITDLAVETVERRAGEPATDEAVRDMTGLVHGFRSDIATIYGVAVEPKSTLRDEAARCPETFKACLSAFHEDHARLAGEILAAIDAGDAKGAIGMLEKRESEHYVPFHDRIIRYMAETFGWALRHYGNDELLRFQLGTAEGQRSGFEAWEKMPAEEFAQVSAFLLKQHLGHVEISEDDEKFTIDMSPCGSGGRLRRSGGYEGEGGTLPFVEGAGPLTFGKDRLPVYCSHCPIWNGSATLNWFGRAHWVFSDPARADGGCQALIYKQPGYTPQAYADAVRVTGKDG